MPAKTPEKNKASSKRRGALRGRRTVPHQVLPDESPSSAQLRDRLTQIALYIKTSRPKLAASKALEATRLPGTPYWEEETAELLERFETRLAPLESRDSIRPILKRLNLDGTRLLDHGRLEGELLAKRTILELQLEQRFGALPTRTRKRINSAVRSDLDVWITRVVAAKSRADIFRE